ncbi:site-specific DNA-methyltransferase [Clostridium sp.]|uniref:site-specific DNA-methyltransferase n=1 Tax=Clostridium sp. TaxID=1506 RepID=UPI00352252CF
MDKLKMQTKNKVDINIETIGNLFPETLTEVIKGYDIDGNAIIEKAIDFEVLKQELSKIIVDGKEERYQMNWPGKKESILRANAPTNKTLRPCREESVNFDTTENLYIEGDNLEVLKLLRETYLNKIKMIYIDPPYNTGNDSFVYDDEFAMSSEEFEKLSNKYDEDGNIQFDIKKNNESNGRIHTDWLNMMYPRLKLAKDLLTSDGVIFISIDDNELDNLKKVCDEIFGESNFLGRIMPIVNPGGRDYKQIALTHEYLLVYSKTEYTQLQEIAKDINFDMNDIFGGYELRDLRNRNPKFHSGNRPNLFYSFYINPDIKDEYGCCSVSLNKENGYNIEVKPYNSTGKESVWRWGVTKANENINLENIKKSQIVAKPKKDGGYIISEKNRRCTSKVKSVWDETSMRTEEGTRLIRRIFGFTPFDHPKPIGLLNRVIEMSGDADTILDFFSGSASLAQAVMEKNYQDGGNRKFIMVQLPEETDEKSEANKAGYKNICEIGKERIRRAGKKIVEENPDKAKELDIGFRVLKLDSSNMKDVYYNPSDYDQNLLDKFESNIKEERSSEDLLFQVMLELGEMLSSDIEEINVNGKKVFNVGDGNIIACFDDDVNEEVITNIAKMAPYYAVFRDSSLTSDSVAANFEQIFKTYSPNTIRKIL